MYAKSRKTGIWKAAGIFFAGMILFTLLSRAVYQHGTAVVATEKPSGGVIAHTVEITGKIVENQELAVNTQPGLRISGVLVNEGQQVAKGDVLFTLDLDYLAEEILNQKQEMEKLKLTIQDGYSQNYAAQQSRANAQAQAEENYDAAVSQAETTLDRAARNLERAQAALDNYYNGTSDREAEEAALKTACQEAESQAAAASAALEALGQEKASAIETALSEAQAAQEEPLTQEQQDDITAEVEQSYTQAIQDAEAALEEANQKKAQAASDLEAFLAAPTDETSEEDLLQNLEAAEEAYEDALQGLTNAETTYGRAIQSASLPESTSHSPQISQISYEQMALTLEKLEALQEAGGEITAPVDGVVTDCDIRTGGKTGDTAALLLADLSKGTRFSGEVTEEQSQYIAVGDRVTLEALSSNKEYNDLTVTTLSPKEGSEGGYQVTVQLTGNSLTLGAGARLRAVRKSGSYTCCVPLSALHVDAHNRPYVLVAETVDTVLGTEVQARAVSVTVLDKNGKTAALEEGSLHPDQQVIVSSDRLVDGGSRVRVQ